MHDEELRQWLERYITKHPHHPTAVLSRYQFIGYAKRALDAYLAGTYFLPQEEGGEGADPNTSGIEEAVRGFRQQIEGVERHGYLGTFVETSAWKYLRHACDTAINEQAIVVCYGRPGVGKTRCILEYVVQKMSTVPVQVLCSRNTTPWAFGRVLAEEIGLELPRGTPTLHLLEIELARKLMRSPRPIFVDQANYLQERSLGTLCFLWEKRHIPIVLVGTKTLFENFYQSKLTEDVRGQLTSRIALHYLLPELTKVETEAILRHAFGEEVTDEMVEQIHQVTGGNFRSVDMMIPRILELERRNRQKLADGTVKMNEIIKVAAARLMV
jgi:DNA transposition AAA+ family ATPase